MTFLTQPLDAPAWFMFLWFLVAVGIGNALGWIVHRLRQQQTKWINPNAVQRKRVKQRDTAQAQKKMRLGNSTPKRAYKRGEAIIYDKYCLLAPEDHEEAGGFCICDLLEMARADERQQEREAAASRVGELSDKAAGEGWSWIPRALLEASVRGEQP